MALKKHEDSYFYCITFTYCVAIMHSILLLAAITFMFLEELIANQFAN